MTKLNSKMITNIVVVGKSGAGKQPRIDILAEEFKLEQLSTGDIFRFYLKKFNDFGYKGDIEQFFDKDKNKFILDENIAIKIKSEDPDVILGLKASYFVNRGLFVPDYITNELFESAFAKKKFKKQIIDGYPRTTDQSKYLIDLINKHNSNIDFILLVDNTDERILQRTVKRRICPICKKVYHLDYKPPISGKFCKCGAEVIQRSDDTKEKIKSRLKEYKEKALPAIDYLNKHNIPIVKVSGHLKIFTKENVYSSIIDEVKKIL